MLWSIQAWLGILDAVGLFSPPDLPFCQLVELALLTFTHGLRTLIHPCFECNWINGKRPGPEERRRFLLGSIFFTVLTWLDAIFVSPSPLPPCYRAEHDIDMLT
jgi:hypothetical protein